MRLTLNFKYNLLLSTKIKEFEIKKNNKIDL